MMILLQVFAIVVYNKNISLHLLIINSILQDTNKTIRTHNGK